MLGRVRHDGRACFTRLNSPVQHNLLGSVPSPRAIFRPYLMLYPVSTPNPINTDLFDNIIIFALSTSLPFGHVLVRHIGISRSLSLGMGPFLEYPEALNSGFSSGESFSSPWPEIFQRDIPGASGTDLLGILIQTQR